MTIDPKAVEAVAKAIADAHWLEEAQAAITAYHAYLAEQGLVVAPKEPTKAMLDAEVDFLGSLNSYLDDWSAEDVWRAMVAAYEAEQGDAL